MSKTLTRTLALLGTLVALSTAALDASAATIRVKCETRTGRSSASIDGAALAAGTYSAVLTSGTHTARSLVANSVAGEVGFDFARARACIQTQTRIGRNRKAVVRWLDLSGERPVVVRRQLVVGRIDL